MNKLSNYKYVNIGASAEEMIPGWLSVGLDDINNPRIHLLRKEYTNIYVHEDHGGECIMYDVRNGLPFEDESIDILYSSHFIEHLTYIDAVKFLDESYRVLKKDGLFRLSCPDISIWIDKVYHNDTEFLDRYKKPLEKGWAENECYPFHKKIKNRYQILNSMIYNWGHKWMWEYNSLSKELDKVGFSFIEKKNFLNTSREKTLELETLVQWDIRELRESESIFIECTKSKI